MMEGLCFRRQWSMLKVTPLSANQIALDVNLKIGSDMHEQDSILNKLVESEIIDHENFVSENPETNLPSSVEID
jgi:hypothetical protein